MSKKFEEFTGGMSLRVFALIAVIILGIIIATSAVSEEYRLIALFATTAIVILIIRVVKALRR